MKRFNTHFDWQFAARKRGLTIEDHSHGTVHFEKLHANDQCHIATDEYGAYVGHCYELVPLQERENFGPLFEALLAKNAEEYEEFEAAGLPAVQP